MGQDDRRYDAMLERARADGEFYRTVGRSIDDRLATWIMVANGAALIFCLNALVQGRICDWTEVRPIAFVFLVGLASAYFSASYSRQYFDTVAEWYRTVADRGDQTSEVREKLTQLRSRSKEITEDNWLTGAGALQREIEELEKVASRVTNYDAAEYERTITSHRSRFRRLRQLGIACFAIGVGFATLTPLSTKALCRAPIDAPVAFGAR